MTAAEIAMIVVAGVTIVGGVTWVAYLSRQSTEQAKLTATTAVTLATVAERVKEVGELAHSTSSRLTDYIDRQKDQRIAVLEAELRRTKEAAHG